MNTLVKFRKLLVALTLVLNVVLISSAQICPDSRILFNTFKITGDSMTGTCFRISDGRKNMIVTARHLFKKHI